MKRPADNKSTGAFDKWEIREASPMPFRVIPLPQVAEDIVARDIPNWRKVRILLAIVRALSGPELPTIKRIDDVDRLILTNPEAFEWLLRSYWVLLGARRRAA
jgi:hypothetical protein